MKPETVEMRFAASEICREAARSYIGSINEAKGANMVPDPGLEACGRLALRLAEQIDDLTLLKKRCTP